METINFRRGVYIHFSCGEADKLDAAVLKKVGKQVEEEEAEADYRGRFLGKFISGIAV